MRELCESKSTIYLYIRPNPLQSISTTLVNFPEPTAAVKAMRRVYALVANALRNNEPVLLVGETGCGKTTVCQMLADAFGKSLFVVNAHQNTETVILLVLNDQFGIGRLARANLLRTC